RRISPASRLINPALTAIPYHAAMAYEAIEFDANLSAVCGDDSALRAELFAGFLDSLSTQVDLLGRARCDGNWTIAASRIRGLGSSFHVPVLVRMGEEALDSAPGDPVIVRRLREFTQSFGMREG